MEQTKETKIEYTTVVNHLPFSDEAGETKLINNMQRQGWELVTLSEMPISPHAYRSTTIYKRETTVSHNGTKSNVERGFKISNP